MRSLVSASRPIQEFTCARRFRPGVRLADITFTPDGKEVLSFGRDRVSRLWDAATGKELFHFNLSERGQWALTPDKRTIVTTAYGREVRVWETSTGHKPRSAPWCISQFL